MLVEVAEGGALCDAEGRRPVVEALLHAGQGEAYRTEPVEQVPVQRIHVRSWRIPGWLVHGGADGNRTHDPLLAKQVL